MTAQVTVETIHPHRYTHMYAHISFSTGFEDLCLHKASGLGLMNDFGSVCIAPGCLGHSSCTMCHTVRSDPDKKRLSF